MGVFVFVLLLMFMYCNPNNFDIVSELRFRILWHIIDREGFQQTQPRKMSTTPPESAQPNQTINPMDLLEKLMQLTQAITLQQTQMVAMQSAAITNP